MKKTLHQLLIIMSKRKLQALYDQHRQLEREKQNAEDELNELKDQIKEMEPKLTDLQDQMKEMEIDLVQQKKITFKEVTFEEWLEDSKEEEFWIYTTDAFRQMGIWKGLDDLSEDDRGHFDEYQRDYFYYGGPNYVDANHPRAECTECELAFEGDCSLTSLRRCDI